MTDGRWVSVGDGVYVRRHEELDLSTGLVLGERGCLVIDTRGDAAQGAELAAAVRELTPLPWTVVLTHAHFDHGFGTSAFEPCAVWAHEGCRAVLADEGPADRARWARRYRDEGRADVAAALEATRIVLPDRLVTGRTELNLGRRKVVFDHFGPAHTGHDLVVHVPDTGVVFAGDLVEHTPTGSFTADSFGPDTTLHAWPSALDGVLALTPRVVVPGHGEPVDREFTEEARETLARLAALRTAVEAGDLQAARARELSPCPADVTDAALALQ